MGVPQQVDLLTGRLHDRRNVLRLAFEGVFSRVAAQAPAAPVHRYDGEVLLQGGKNRCPAAVVRGGAMNQNQRRAVATPPRDDRCPVGRNYGRLVCHRWQPNLPSPT